MAKWLQRVEARIKEVLSKTDQQVPEDQLKYARISLTRGLLRQAIQNKMMRESFLLDQVGTQNAEKRSEADATLAARARQMFHESEIPELYKQYNAHDITELDDKLRQKGSSLAARQRDFTDAMLGHLYMSSRVEKKPNVSIAEIAEYYAEHREDYFQTDQARWEQLTVLQSNFPTAEEAMKAITAMGREAYFGGNVQAVARAKSQEPFASSGGLHDWTPKGSLASEKLEEQVFSIPLNRMSEIIADDQGFHIIRVLERRAAGVKPLSELQDEIRSKIRAKKISDSQEKLLRDMEQRVSVWSLFPEDIKGAMPLPESVANRPPSLQDGNRF